jgi:AcrR family transcriptional regulator
MARPSFEHAAFLTAARDIAAQNGPAAVTVTSVTERLGAPSGSFYYRFPSRDILLAELWLATALAFQQGFVAAIKAGDGLTAALHTPVWVRAHLDDARVFLLHHRDDFVQGGWPAALTARVAQQARRVDACYKRFARDAFGGVNAEKLRLARFVLADVPKAAVNPHLRRREPPPLIVDDMIRITYRAIQSQYGKENRTTGR